MLSPSRRRTRRAPGTLRPRRFAVLAPVVAPVMAAVLVVTGCTGDGDQPAPAASPSSESSPSAETTRPPVRTNTQVGQVAGQLPKKSRRVVSRRLSRVVDRWWQQAYLGGDFPRRRFSRNVFPGFTPGARAQARNEMVLMSNAALASRVDSVTARRRRVDVDLLAVDGRVKGATARVLLVYQTTGKRAGRFEVQGRTYLTPTPDGWRIFGYDLHRSEVRKRRGQSAGSSQQKTQEKQGPRHQDKQAPKRRKKEGRR